MVLLLKTQNSGTQVKIPERVEVESRPLMFGKIGTTIALNKTMILRFRVKLCNLAD